MPDPRVLRLAQVLVDYSVDVQPGRRVLITGTSLAAPLNEAVGAGFPDTGSQNRSGLHWNMICDMRQGGEIWVDGDLFYQNGAFTV